MDRTRKDPPDKKASPHPQEQPVGSEGTRCPFCHDTCASEAEVAVCRECLTRHHAECWAENERLCASCGADRALHGETLATKEQAATWEVGSGVLWSLWAVLCAVLALIKFSVIPRIYDTYAEFGVAVPMPIEILLEFRWLVPLGILSLLPLGFVIKRFGKVKQAPFVGLLLALLTTAALAGYLAWFNFPGSFL